MKERHELQYQNNGYNHHKRQILYHRYPDYVERYEEQP